MEAKQGLTFFEKVKDHEAYILTASLAILLVLGAVYFGPNVLVLAFWAYVATLGVELTFSKIRKKPLGKSWLVTPLVFVLLLPPTVPVWLVIIGSAFGTFFGKSVFGGEGKNIFNPAIVGLLFVTISFPVFMNTRWASPFDGVIGTSHPLIVLNGSGPFNYTFNELLFGLTPGTIGEGFRLVILALGAFLIVIKIIDWRVPLFYIGSVFVLTFLGNTFMPSAFPDAVTSLFVGALLFGAVFVASDPVTMPVSAKGRIYYGLGLGALTVLIRNFAAFPEGLIFSVIIMNAIAPLLDKQESEGVI